MATRVTRSGSLSGGAIAREGVVKEEQPLAAAPSPVRRDRLGFRSEAARKAIHLSTVAVPLLVWVLPRPMGLALLGTGVAVALLVEVTRGRIRWVRYHFLRRTRRLLRGEERRGFAGATYMAIAYFLALLLLPLPIAVLAMLYTALGDSAAALIGKRWGRHRATWGKSLEGAAAGFIVDLLAGAMIPGIPGLAILLGAGAATILEFFPLPLDDNLRVTLGGGMAAWAGAALTGVGL